MDAKGSASAGGWKCEVELAASSASLGLRNRGDLIRGHFLIDSANLFATRTPSTNRRQTGQESESPIETGGCYCAPVQTPHCHMSGALPEIQCDPGTRLPGRAERQKM